jgi:hypothetical protein
MDYQVVIVLCSSAVLLCKETLNQTKKIKKWEKHILLINYKMNKNILPPF